MSGIDSYIDQRDHEQTDRQLILHMLATQRMLTAEIARVVAEVEATREITLETLDDVIDLHSAQAAVVGGMVGRYDDRVAARHEQLAGTTWTDATLELPRTSWQLNRCRRR